MVVTTGKDGALTGGPRLHEGALSWGTQACSGSSECWNESSSRVAMAAPIGGLDTHEDALAACEDCAIGWSTGFRVRIIRVR